MAEQEWLMAIDDQGAGVMAPVNSSEITTVPSYNLDAIYIYTLGRVDDDPLPRARLIAAAPALLAACKAVVEECDATFVDTSEMSPEWCEVEKMCRAAIAIAEQEQTDAH